MGDKWTRDLPLKLKFPRLHTLSLNVDSTVCEMGEWVNSGNEVDRTWDLCRRRELFVREKELEMQLSELLSTAQWRREVSDKRLWDDGDINYYTVRSGYKA